MVTIRDIKTICTAPEGINLLVVKVETSEPGLYGLGCGTFAYRHLAVKLVVEEYLRPLLIGRDVSDINDIWQLMHQNGYWRNGPIENNAISGVDMALWDIKGKMANMPLYQLFGGKCREGVPVYRHVDGRDLSEICENIAKYREIGVKTIRCQCGGYGGSEYGHTPAGVPVGAKPGVYLDGNAYIRDTVKLFDGIRSKMGDEIGLVHDVHERIAPADAVRLAKELEPYHLTFLEDPVSLEQVEYIRQIKNASSIPIAEGELFNNPYEYRTLITERLIDYIRVHITQVGVVLLTLTLCTGLFYMKNLFSVENIDKAVLSIIAWFVYIVLLWGHYHEGWRGRRVVWFNVAGAGILTLAYFGSRFIQQFAG